ncbi:glycosyltransferase [Janibacter sp. G368]|uniref:glycosyltransferase n=1 Tax=Janibacter sp. G368 TaxID=3420441 RepID=UPI003D052BEC
MASLSERAGLGPTTAVEVGTSLDLFSHTPKEVEALLGQRYALVPGSLQPYKNPHAAIDYMLRHLDAFPVDTIAFVGSGSTRQNPHAPSLHNKAISFGIEVQFMELSRSEILWALTNSQVTILASKLESLSFALGEALYLSPAVVASPIPAHIEVSKFLGAQPINLESDSMTYTPPSKTIKELYTGWQILAEALSRA